MYGSQVLTVGLRLEGYIILTVLVSVKDSARVSYTPPIAHHTSRAGRQHVMTTIKARGTLGTTQQEERTEDTIVTTYPSINYPPPPSPPPHTPPSHQPPPTIATASTLHLQTTATMPTSMTFFCPAIEVDFSCEWMFEISCLHCDFFSFGFRSMCWLIMV